MPRTKSLATLIEHYGDERVFKPRAIKIPSVYKILKCINILITNTSK